MAQAQNRSAFEENVSILITFIGKNDRDRFDHAKAPNKGENPGLGSRRTPEDRPARESFNLECRDGLSRKVKRECLVSSDPRTSGSKRLLG